MPHEHMLKTSDTAPQAMVTTSDPPDRALRTSSA